MKKIFNTIMRILLFIEIVLAYGAFCAYLLFTFAEKHVCNDNQPIQKTEHRISSLENITEAEYLCFMNHLEDHK